MTTADDFDRDCMARVLGFAYDAAEQQDVNVRDQMVAALDEGNVCLDGDEAGVLVTADGYRLTLVAWPLVFGATPGA